MENFPHQDCCFIYLYIEDEDNYTIQEGGVIEQGRDFGCLIDNLSDDDLEALRQWVKHFIDTDEFLRSKNCGPFAAISRFEFIIDRVPSAAWEVLDIEPDAVSDNTAGNETSEDEYFDFAEDNETHQRQSKKKFLKTLHMGHNDYQQYIKGKSEAEIRGDLEKPHRILYEIARRAAVPKNSLTKSISADNEPLDLIISKNKKKGGRPEKKRTKWILERHNEGLSPLKICKAWNDLPEKKRKEIDPCNPDKYDLSSEISKTRERDKVRKTIEYHERKKGCAY